MEDSAKPERKSTPDPEEEGRLPGNTACPNRLAAGESLLPVPTLRR